MESLGYDKRHRSAFARLTRFVPAIVTDEKAAVATPGKTPVPKLFVRPRSNVTQT
jgi:hypothetical protein